jgi:hypothetical protein
MDITGFRHHSATDTRAFIIMIVASSVLALSQVPHFKLYAEKRDADILRIAVLSLCLALPVTVACTYLYGSVGTALGTLIRCGVAADVQA